MGDAASRSVLSQRITMKLTVLLFALFAACASAFSPSASFGPSPMGVARISTGPTMMAAKGGRPNPFNPDGSFNVAFREWEFQQKQQARVKTGLQRNKKLNERVSQNEFTLTGVQEKRAAGQKIIHYFQSRVAPDSKSNKK